ncbi:MAG TPA: glycerophosphodiester phosphodiesterase, partial [Fibrella sp.]
MKLTLFRFILYSLLIAWTSHLAGCRPGLNDAVLIPKLLNDELNVEGAKLLYSQTRKACEGVYQVSDGSQIFGGEIVAKW